MTQHGDAGRCTISAIMDEITIQAVIQKIIKPDDLYPPSGILNVITECSNVKKGQPRGVYCWWFKDCLADIPLDGTNDFSGFTLLYLGTSKRPICERIKYHLLPDASRSTLRKSLGCLLRSRLGLLPQECRTVKGKRKYNWGPQGEEKLTEWMEKNARVSWVESSDPLKLERHLIRKLSLPLNLKHNGNHPFYPVLKKLRDEVEREFKNAS